MAKLSAKGRTTVVEVTREYDRATLQTAHDRYQRSYKPDYVGGSDVALTQWERVTRRLMSDGSVLEKRDVQFQPDWLDKQGRKYSYGWKLHGKLKAGLTPADFARVYREPRKDGRLSPWTVKEATEGRALPKPVVISQKRIMQAVESGESIGFCTECGAEQYGCEPDANGYQCESCGAMAVTGAEELLLQIA